MQPNKLIDYFQQSRHDEQLATIEGVQALKHATRFKAKFSTIITCDIKLLEKLLSELAPDISQKVLNLTEEVSEATFNKLSPQPPRTKVIALTERKAYDLTQIAVTKPIVFLEEPRDLENIGAVIRVSAAADAAAVVISGPADIWHPAVIRGAAGLQYAVPVFNASLAEIVTNRSVVALDPTGEPISSTRVPKNAVFVFGTERYGISQVTLDRADQILRLPMKPGVSSLNLATSVAATLYMM